MTDTNHRRVDITDARPGDEILQAGTWEPIASVDFMRHSSNVRIGFPGGGSASFPVSHRPAVRRAVEPAHAATCEACQRYAASLRDEHVAEVVARAPEMDAATRERITRIFRAPKGDA